MSVDEIPQSMLTTFPASAPDDGNHRAQWQQLLSRLTPEARQQIEGFRTIVGRNGKWILDQYATVKKLWDEHLPGTSLDEFLGGTNVLQAVAQCQKLGRDGKTAAKKLHEGPWKLDHLTLVQNFEADMATSTRFLQLLVDFSKLTENFDLALAFICKARDLRTKSIGLHRGTHRDKPWQPSDVSTGIATFKVQLNVPSKRKRKHFEESGDAKWAASEGLRLENKRRQWDIKDAGLVQEAEDTELMQEADTVQAQEADQKPNGPITIPRSPSVEMGRGKIEGPITPSISDFASLGGVSDDDDEDEDENEYENEPSTQLGGSLPYLGNDGTTEVCALVRFLPTAFSQPSCYGKRIVLQPCDDPLVPKVLAPPLIVKHARLLSSFQKHRLLGRLPADYIGLSFAPADPASTLT